MSKYFTSVYKNYLEKIEENKSIETNRNSLIEKMSTLDSSLNNYANYIENSSWSELGKTEIINSYIPKVKSIVSMLTSGITNNLNKVVDLVNIDLYDLLIKLKDKDNEYCVLQDKINSNIYDSSDLEYNNGKLKVMDKILVDLVKQVDEKILEIKKYNNLDEQIVGSFSPIEGVDLTVTRDELLKLYNMTHSNEKDDSIVGKLKAQAEKNKISKMLSGEPIYKRNNDSENVTETFTDNNELDNSNCIDLSLLDANWKVVNTKLSVSEYASLVYNKGIRQNSNSERYGDLCLAFSYVHASNLYNGETSDNAESAYNWNHAGEFTDYFNDNKQETLVTVYNEIKSGKPVVMQVNGNKSGTSRHFVTVVGVKSDVKKAEDIKESDLLILDSWDAQLERMDTNSSRFMTTGKETNKSYSGYYLRLLK